MGQGFSVPPFVGNVTDNVIGLEQNLGSTIGTFIVTLLSNHRHNNSYRLSSANSHGTHPSNSHRRIPGEETSDRRTATTMSVPPNDDIPSLSPLDQAATVVPQQAIRFLKKMMAMTTEKLSTAVKEQKTVKITGSGGTPVYSQGIIDIHGSPAVYLERANTTNCPTKVKRWTVSMIESEPQTIPFDQLSNIEIYVGSVKLCTTDSTRWPCMIELEGSDSALVVDPFFQDCETLPLEFELSNEEVFNAPFNDSVQHFVGIQSLPIRYGVKCISLLFERNPQDGMLWMVDDLLRKKSVQLSDEKWLSTRYLLINLASSNTPMNGSEYQWESTYTLVLQGLLDVGFNDEYAPSSIYYKGEFPYFPRPTEKWKVSVKSYIALFLSFLSKPENNNKKKSLCMHSPYLILKEWEKGGEN